MNSLYQWTRRSVLQAGLSLGLSPTIGWGASDNILQRTIAASNESLPVIGLGTARAFDVPETPDAIVQRAAVIDTLIKSGASLVDTSPMYGNAETVIGEIIRGSDRRQSLFLASKVWTEGRAAGEIQIRQSMERMATDKIDLMQVHNLRDLDTQLPTIKEWQARGNIRYSGVTTSRRNAFVTLADVMKKWRPDFVQLNYSLGERDAEEILLPLAQELGIAVLVNRPFMNGALFRAVKNSTLPDWAAEFSAASWGQLFLKYIVSHPAVNCVIPATTKAHHMIDNLGAGFGELPDVATRRRIENWFANL